MDHIILWPDAPRPAAHPPAISVRAPLARAVP
jgi:hypothetical protein